MTVDIDKLKALLAVLKEDVQRVRATIRRRPHSPRPRRRRSPAPDAHGRGADRGRCERGPGRHRRRRATSSATSPFVGIVLSSFRPTPRHVLRRRPWFGRPDALHHRGAMKLMNEIEAELSGTVVGVYAQNGKAVEFGQKLFPHQRGLSRGGTVWQRPRGSDVVPHAGARRHLLQEDPHRESRRIALRVIRACRAARHRHRRGALRGRHPRSTFASPTRAVCIGPSPGAPQLPAHSRHHGGRRSPARTRFILGTASSPRTRSSRDSRQVRRHLHRPVARGDARLG